MAKQDFYQTLGVSKSSSDKDIKAAYRKMAMQYHPDRNPGDKKAETKFKEVAEAYEILKDDQKRAAYDQYGHGAFDQGAGGRGGFGQGQSQGQGGFNDFSDIFSSFGDIFGDGGRSRKRSSAIRGSDIRYNLDITLEEAFSGLTKKVSFSVASSCAPCKGSGAAGGSKPENCGTCSGSGKVRAQQGFFIVERACTSCGGIGQIIKNKCKTCGGQGRIDKEKTLSVKIPAGVEDGNRIRLSGEGEAGARGGSTGDLYVFISVKNHKFFDRKGDDIFCDVPIKITTAALGGSVEVPTIDGIAAKLTIPEGTSTNDQFRLKNKGMTIINSGGRRADMYVKIFVETPKKLTADQKSLFEQLDKTIGSESGGKAEGFFDKLFK
ncbi:MAG: molecular chaperone DnaJ [Rickettsiales bacterium]|jgi:molecular chaperone DnaJ